MSRIMGLAPFSVDLQNTATESSQWVRLSYPWLAYSIGLYVGYLYCFALCVEESWKIPLENNYPIVSVIGENP